MKMSFEHFPILKLACSKFMQCSTKENLQELHELLRNIKNPQFDNLQTYILLPLVVKLDVLEDRQHSAIKDQLINCISFIISNCRLKDLNALKTILIIIIKQIHDFNTGITKSELSEEIKLSAIECITITLDRCTTEVLEKFYTTNNSGIFGKIAIVCVDFINNEKYKKLRLESIKCLMQTFYVHDRADFNDRVMRNSVADVMFLFLPKIIQTLYKVAMGDDKQGETIISTSIRALGRILCLIYEDYTNEILQNELKITDFIELLKQNKSKNAIDNTNSICDDSDADYEILGGRKSKHSNNEEKFEKLKSAGRNSKWLGASSRKLKPLLTSMSILRANQSTIVREEYAKICCQLSEKCLNNLKENFSIFFENLITFSQDDNENIRTECSECIKNIKNSNSNLIFYDCIEYLFDNCITRLPRIIQRSDEFEQLKDFQFLKGFLQILSDNELKMILSLPGNLEKLCMCLISILDMKLDNNLLIEEYAIRDITENSNLNIQMPWRRFTYCDSIKVFKIIEDIFKILQRTDIILIIFDHLMELFRKKLPIINEIILCLNLLLGSYDGETSTVNEIHKLIDSVLDELLDEIHWNLEIRPTQKTLTADKNSEWYVDKTPGLYESAIEIKIKNISYDEDEDYDENFITVSDAQFNVLHTCIVLDTIGGFSLSFGTKFNIYMCKILHRILCKAGSSNYMIFKAGNYALNCIQTALQLNSINQLIQEYSDYISFSINKSLKNDDECKNALDILNAIFKYDCLKDTSKIYNIISTLLEEISKSSQFSFVSSYLNVFHKFLLYIQKQYENISNDQIEFESDTTTVICSQNIYENLIEVLNKINNVDDAEIGNIDELSIEENQEINNEEISNKKLEEEEEEIEEEKKIELPEHIKVIIDVLKEILKFISSKEQIQKILSIECLTVGIPLIKDYENELLPIVHLIWYSFNECFKDNDSIVLNRCFDLLRILCIYAKDFLLQRTLKDVIPHLNKFLKESSKNSQKEHNLTQTQEYKLQMKLLQYYADIIISLGINEKDLNNIIDVMILYLNRKQPKSLQEYAVQHFLRISNYNKPFIYIKLSYYSHDHDFEQNVKIIFKHILKQS